MLYNSINAKTTFLSSNCLQSPIFPQMNSYGKLKGVEIKNYEIKIEVLLNRDFKNNTIYIF